MLVNDGQIEQKEAVNIEEFTRGPWQPSAPPSTACNSGRPAGPGQSRTRKLSGIALAGIQGASYLVARAFLIADSADGADSSKAENAPP